MFKIIKKSKKSRARLGIIQTAHGKIMTPAFIPVATQAAVKGLTAEQLCGIGSPALLCNTYHLHLRPGEKLIKKMGGLHRLMNWPGPIFTDSGGFQVFSLGLALEHNVGKLLSREEIASPRSRGVRNDGEIAEPVASRAWQSPRDDGGGAKKSLIKITEKGVEFQSHLDGSKYFLTPEKSIQIQRDLGADIIFAFDECTSPLSSRRYTEEAMARTHRWAERCLKAFRKNGGQFLFGIVQGGEYQDLREQSAKFIAALPFDGLAIGGSFGDSLGKSKKDMHRVLDWTAPLLPENKPRHLLGIGDLDGIKEAVKRGIDTFDCVAPTRLARNGVGLIKSGRINLTNARYRADKRPLIKNCPCYACANFSRAYLRHLFKANEMLGPILATIHNLCFMENYMRELRRRIKYGDL